MHPKIERALADMTSKFTDSKEGSEVELCFRVVFMQGLMTAFEIAATEPKDIMYLAIFEAAAERMRVSARAQDMIRAKGFTVARGGDGADFLGPRKGGGA